jgi:hypothetical protein
MKIRCYFLSALGIVFYGLNRGSGMQSKILKVKTTGVRFWYQVSSSPRTRSNSGVSKSWDQNFVEPRFGFRSCVGHVVKTETQTWTWLASSI